jgi:hypothetical protein
LYSNLGLVSEEKIELIERFAKQNAFKKNKLSTPVLTIKNEDKLSLSTKASEIKLTTEAFKGDTTLDQYQVWVNGVPAYAPKEQPIAKKENKWNIPLQRGRNDIRLVCYDVLGNPSNSKEVVITCTKPYVRPNLYLAIVSVSDYKDGSMNLEYPVKDGKDLSSVFVEENGKNRIGFPSRFGSIYVDSFYNKEATRNNVISWKEKLKKSKPEDYAILYVSGHGLLDSSMNFWFATHDVDFENPAERGLSFDQLEGLLVGIPARQKLFMMDACHSGEVLKDEIILDSAFILPDGSKGQLKGYKYRGAVVEDEDGSSINKSELKQELFSNYDSKSGATVISAAAGKGVALESSRWGNGVFTFTVIGGLIHRWADANDDGDVTVVELSRYVNKMVKEQTKGQQVPNDRQENLENNFRIW